MYKQTSATKSTVSLARPLAPEELRPGQCIVILNMLGEFPPDDMSSVAGTRTDVSPVRILWLTPYTRPLRVLEVCLPMVLVKSERGRHEVLDTRRFRFARVPRRFAQAAISRFRAERRRRRERKRAEERRNKDSS